MELARTVAERPPIAARLAKQAVLAAEETALSRRPRERAPPLRAGDGDRGPGRGDAGLPREARAEVRGQVSVDERRAGRRRRRRHDGRRDRPDRGARRLRDAPARPGPRRRWKPGIERLRERPRRRARRRACGARRKPTRRAAASAPPRSLGDLGECDLVIEAAPEDLELKRELFAALAEACGPEAILASNTSSLPVTAIAAEVAAPRARRRHALLQPAGADEAGRGGRHRATPREAALEATTEVGRRMGRTPIRAKDSPGFIANRLARPFTLESLRMLAEGVADARDDRPRLPARRRLPHGPVRADRPDRPRRQPQRRPLLLRPGRRARALAPERDPGADGRRGPARAARAAAASTPTATAPAPRAPIPTCGIEAPTLDPAELAKIDPAARRRSSPAWSPRSPTRRPSRSKRRSARPPTWTRRCGSASTGRAARSSSTELIGAERAVDLLEELRSRARRRLPARRRARGAERRAQPATEHTAPNREALIAAADDATSRRRAAASSPPSTRRGSRTRTGRTVWELRVLRLPRRRAARRPPTRASGASRQPEPHRRPLRAGAGLLPAARLRPLEHARGRGRRGDRRDRPAGLGRDRRGGAGALPRAPRRAPGHRPDLHPQPRRPLRRRQGRRLRRRRSRPARIPVLAPAGFLHHAVSENVFAGTAMGRRAGYMYGALLERGADGQLGSGLGQTTSLGTITLIPPTSRSPRPARRRPSTGCG